ncbi:MAG: AtpZ/AtpI family protein [bacterium]|nr:AtpZ/AtpI family protein [bacterium]
MGKVQKDNKNQADKEWLRRALMIFSETTGWIAFPIVGALFLGRYLDEKQGTEPLYFLSITALAFIISSIGIGMTGVKYLKQIEKAEGLVRPVVSAVEPSREKDLKKKKDNEFRDSKQQSK